MIRKLALTKKQAPKRLLFEIPIRDRAVQCGVVPIALAVRTRRPSEDEAKGESRVLWSGLDHRDTCAVENANFEMQEILSGVAEPANGMGKVIWDDAKKCTVKQEV